MWMFRITLLGVVVVLECGATFLERYRTRFPRLTEHRGFNIAMVIVGHALIYLVVILPPAGGWSARPAWFRHTIILVGFPAVGAALLCAGLVLLLLSLKERNAIGLQDSQEGLITSGVYQHFGHPICTGIMWVSLGLALLTRNPDGLLILPAFFVWCLVQVLMEERFDIGRRFREQYQVYKQNTQMFGPMWVWIALLVTLLLLIGLALSRELPPQ